MKLLCRVPRLQIPPHISSLLTFVGLTLPLRHLKPLDDVSRAAAPVSPLPHLTSGPCAPLTPTVLELPFISSTCGSSLFGDSLVICSPFSALGLPSLSALATHARRTELTISLHCLIAISGLSLFFLAQYRVNSHDAFQMASASLAAHPINQTKVIRVPNHIPRGTFSIPRSTRA
jgi:hypothetical protein